MKCRLIVKVTPNKYEFPIVIADSISEMSNMTGDKESLIKHCINKYYRSLKNPDEPYKYGKTEYRSIELTKDDLKEWEYSI